jgi:hypothetical protein
MKHLKHTLQIYVYSYYTICNILIYFTISIYNTYNIPLKHLKHLKHIIATYAFSVASACCLDEWRLVDAKLDAGAEVADVELVGGVDLGRGKSRRMERGRGGRCVSVQGHAARAGGGDAGGAPPPKAWSVLEQRRAAR